MSCLLSKNLDTVFEDPKRIITKTNLAFSHNTYCVKTKFIAYLFMRYLSNMQVIWLHIINTTFFSKTCISTFFNKIENKPTTTCGNPWLPLDLNYAIKFMPYSNIMCKVVVESWHCQDKKYLWKNCNGIKKGKGM